MANRLPAANRAVGPGGQSRVVPDSVARHVWVASGGRCTICNKYLLGDQFTGHDVPIGQLAHIVGWSTAAGSPRGDDGLPVERRNTPDNLMLLCHDQHRVIDHRSLWEVFDTATLRAMKRRHEDRIWHLTGLTPDSGTTVLRVVGNIHGQPVELNSHTVTAALLARNRFPDWTLRGSDEFEIDLRAIPGERHGTSEYWTAARSLLEDRLEYLSTQVRKERVNHISIFALARIPVLVMLGTMLDKTLKVDIYPKRRDTEKGWGWDELATPVEFTFVLRRDGADPRKVAVLFSVSGTVDITRLPAEFDHTCTIYELRPVAVLPTPELIKTQNCLDRFSRTWRTLLATIEAEHPGAETIAIFTAAPAAAAVAIGRHLMRAAHPPLRIYDRAPHTGTYQFTVETNR